jgi:hypothetical protein
MSGPSSSVTRAIASSAVFIPDRFMIELSDEVVIEFAGKGGMLERLIPEVKGKKIKVRVIKLSSSQMEENHV